MATIINRTIPLIATFSEVLLGPPGSEQIAEIEVETDIETTTIPRTAYADEDLSWQITEVRVRKTMPDGSERWERRDGKLARLIREWLERHALRQIEDAAEAERLEEAA